MLSTDANTEKKDQNRTRGLWTIGILTSLFAAFLVIAILCLYTRAIVINDISKLQEESLRLLGLSAVEFLLVATWMGLSAGAAGRASAAAQQLKQIGELAYTDLTTGLPNRAVMLEKLSTVMRSHRQHSLLLVEVRDFSSIYTIYGLHLGDRVLRVLGQRLNSLIKGKPSAELGYISLAQFVILAPGERSEVRQLADAILRSFSNPIQVAAVSLRLAVQIGHHTLVDPQTPDAALKRLEAAVAQARDLGPNQIQELSPELMAGQDRRTLVRSLMSQAWEEREFEVYYQPQVELASNRIRGYEALMRWTSPRLGVIAPSEFIPVAEENGSIVELGRWAILEGLRFCKELEKRGSDSVVSINVSAVQIHSPGFLESIRALIESLGVNPHFVGLELTESIMIRADDELQRTLEALAAFGVKVSLDDFGTGYSSLNSLHRIPLKVLKIDKRFVDALQSSERSTLITRSLIDMAHNLGLTVIAEGVETEVQRTLLTVLGCDQIQGYLVGKPAPMAEQLAEIPFKRFIRTHGTD